MSAREILKNWDSVTDETDRKEIYDNILACERAGDYLKLLKEFRDNARARAQSALEDREATHFLGAARLVDDLVAEMLEHTVPDPE